MTIIREEEMEGSIDKAEAKRLLLLPQWKEGVAKIGGQRISGRSSKCVALLCMVSWFLAGWLANPQGILRRQKLSGFRPCGRCGTLGAGDSRGWLECAMVSPGRPGRPCLPCRRPAATSMQGPHIKCRNGRAMGWHDWPMGAAGACRMRKGAAKLEGLPYVTLRK